MTIIPINKSYTDKNYVILFGTESYKSVMVVETLFLPFLYCKDKDYAIWIQSESMLQVLRLF